MALIASTAVPFDAFQTGDWQELYDQFIDSLGNFRMLICPHCHTRGKLRFCRIYKRYFYNSPQDYESGFLLTVCVVRCQGAKCAHEHALFPSWICPYSHFSYPFIISVLNFFFNTANRNLSQTARTFKISRSEVRNLVHKYEKDQLLLREISQLKAERLSPCALLKRLREKREELHRFLEDYLHQIGLPFLMHHNILPFSPRRFTVGLFKVVRDKTDIP